MSLALLVDIDPHRHLSLHLQVKTALIALVDSGQLAGSLPAPAMLARDLRVFSGSIRRAYDELVEMGLFKTEQFGYSVVSGPVADGHARVATAALNQQ